jgi:hypothetical protein
MTQPRNRSFPDYGSGIDVGRDGTVPKTPDLIEPSVPGDVANIFANQLGGTVKRAGTTA